MVSTHDKPLADLERRLASGDSHAAGVRDMFDRIAPTYDTLNRLLSAGIDVRWRKLAIETIAAILDMASIRVLEVATFYTMFNLSPVGKTHVQICTSLSCWLRGSNEVVKACKEKLGIGMGERSPDGKFSLAELECSGACVNAPVIQIGDDYYEDVDYASTGKLLDAFKRGETPKAGSVTGRDGSAPAGEAITLSEKPTPPAKQDFSAAKAAFEKAKAEAAAKAAAPKA